MTTLTTHRPARPAIRYIVGYAAILGAVPYLALKAMWLSGSTIGVRDPEFLGETSVAVLNAVTAGMELVAVLLALALTHNWGQRVPAGLVLLPMWVGSGFLVPIALAMPLAGVASLFATEPGAGGAGLPLEPWVQPMVYGGFAWQGVLLCTAFVLYTRVRWARVWRGDVVREPVASGVRGLGQVAAVVAFLIGCVHLVRAFELSSTSVSGLITEGVFGLLAFGAAGAVLALLHGRGQRVWVPLALLWAGAGALFAWGGWGTLNNVASTFPASRDGLGFQDMLAVAEFLTGPALALVALVVLARPRRAGVPQ